MFAAFEAPLPASTLFPNMEHLNHTNRMKRWTVCLPSGSLHEAFSQPCLQMGYKLNMLKLHKDRCVKDTSGHVANESPPASSSPPTPRAKKTRKDLKAPEPFWRRRQLREIKRRATLNQRRRRTIAQTVTQALTMKRAVLKPSCMRAFQ